MSQVYEKLDIGDLGHSIRLVSLDGIDPDSGQIQCRMEAVLLDFAPDYWSLSYCWGDPDDTTSIICNGFSLTVTKNLDAAMRRLLDFEYRPRFWIDALCINQQDLLEKAEQVANMRAVYSTAQKVVVWLGLEGEDANTNSAVAFDLCRKMSAEAAKPSGKEAERQHHPLKSVWRQMMDESGQWDSIDYLRFSNERDAIDKILAQPWWSRVWVIQELSLARDVSVVCGDSMIAWDVFSRGISHYLDKDKFEVIKMSMSTSTIHHARTLLRFREDTRRPAEADAQGGGIVQHRLLTLLHRFRWFHATDLRDKVYGLLGLAASGPGQPIIDVTYSGDLNSTEDIVRCYASVTIEIIRASQKLDVLQLCRRPLASVVAPGRLQELASWVPDLSADTSRVADGVKTDNLEAASLRPHLASIENLSAHAQHPEFNFSAAGGSRTGVIPWANLKALPLQGFAWDTITELADMMPDVMRGVRCRVIEQDNEERKMNYESESLRETFGESSLLRKHLRVSVVETGEQALRLAAWADMAFAQPVYPTQQPLSQVFYSLLHQGYFGNTWAADIADYEANWGKILSALRRANKYVLSRLLSNKPELRDKATGILATSLSAMWPSMDLSNAVYHHLARTAKGYLALVPVGAKQGDRIVLLRGGSVPFVARERWDTKHEGGGGGGLLGWELVGDCYVHGIMHGEQWEEWSCYEMVFV